MFSKGEFVVSGNKGVCQIDNVTTLDIFGGGDEKDYYILKPVYVPGSTVYVPVDTADVNMRKVLTRDEADKLIESIGEIPAIDITNDKLLEQEYKGHLRTNDCAEWVSVIKTIYLRKQARLEAGRKVTAVDAKYFKIAEDNLYGELAVSLNMPRNEIESYITGKFDK